MPMSPSNGLAPLLLCWLATLTAAAALAFGPKDALRYTTPDALAAAKKVAALQQALTAQQLGLGSLLGANQRQGHTGYTLNLFYQNDPVAIAEAKRSLAQAQRELLAIERTGIRDALLAHAGMWRTQARAQAAEFRQQAAHLAKREVERKLAMGGATALDAEAVTIDAADAELGLHDCKSAAASATATGACYGLTGTAEPDTLLFQLPEASVETMDALRDLELALAIAREEQRAARRAITPGIGLDIIYVSAEYTLSSSLSSRTRSINLQAGYPSIYNDPSTLLWGKGWQNTVKIELPLDFTGWANARSTSAGVALAQARLEQQKPLLALKLAQGRQAALTAGARLEVARARQQLAERKAQVATAREKAGAISPVDLLNARAADQDARAACADAWDSYIQAVASYLELAGARWKEQP